MAKSRKTKVARPSRRLKKPTGRNPRAPKAKKARQLPASAAKRKRAALAKTRARSEEATRLSKGVSRRYGAKSRVAMQAKSEAAAARAAYLEAKASKGVGKRERLARAAGRATERIRTGLRAEARPSPVTRTIREWLPVAAPDEERNITTEHRRVHNAAGALGYWEGRPGAERLVGWVTLSETPRAGAGRRLTKDDLSRAAAITKGWSEEEAMRFVEMLEAADDFGVEMEVDVVY